jgi:hypothetical protein
VHNPAFLITIDTEGDNLWQKHDSITTENARYLPRFQQLCEKYGFKPVYLTNYEMAIDPFYIEFAKDVIARGTAEIGMHLHAWNSPPTDPLTDDDWRHKPYLIEYSDAAMREKVAYMTHLLEDTFQTKMVSHRAGRWAFDERYARCWWSMAIWLTARSRRGSTGRRRKAPRRGTVVPITVVSRSMPISLTRTISVAKAALRCWKCR